MKERKRKCREVHCQRNCSAWILLRFHNSITVRLCLNTTGLHKVHQINCWPNKFLTEFHGLWLFFCMRRYTNPAKFASISAGFRQEMYIPCKPVLSKCSIIPAKWPQIRHCYRSIQVNVLLKFQLCRLSTSLGSRISLPFHFKSFSRVALHSVYLSQVHSSSPLLTHLAREQPQMQMMLLNFYNWIYETNLWSSWKSFISNICKPDYIICLCRFLKEPAPELPASFIVPRVR